jgi:hypothetical protein
MQEQKSKLLFCKFSSNTLPITLQYSLHNCVEIQPTNITDLRFNKSDIQSGNSDITSHELKCFAIPKEFFNYIPQLYTTGDWIIPCNYFNPATYVTTYNPSTGLFGSETTLFDQIPTTQPIKCMRILSYSFDKDFIFYTCITTKQPDNAGSLYFDGKYTLLNNKFPYTILNRRIFTL